jgi:predicted Zn-dependent protease
MFRRQLGRIAAANLLAASLISLQGCFFIFIPGSVIQSISDGLSGNNRAGDAGRVAQATALEKAAKYEDMVTFAQQWTSAEPDNATAWYVEGVALMRVTRAAEAQEAYRQAVSLRENFPAAWTNLAFLVLQQGKPDEALQDGQKALSQQPEYPNAWFVVGAIYNYKGDRAKVLEAYGHIQKTNPALAESFAKTYRVGS